MGAQRRAGRRAAAWVLAGAAVVAATGPAVAQRGEPLPKELNGVGVSEHLGAQVPLDLGFLDENGNPVRLSDYVTGARPVLLMLVYFKCPMLCGLVLQGVVDGLKGLAWTAGKEFDIVTVSINPAETPTLARLKKQSYMRDYARPEAPSGWHFLTGQEAQIRRLADAVGFEYHWDDSSQQFAHPAVIFVLTPGGKIARYLYGVSWDPRTFRMAFTEAGQGTVGRTTDQLLLYCFHYDAESGRYVLAATNLMRAGGAATVLVLGAWLGTAWRRGARRRSHGPGGPRP